MAGFDELIEETKSEIRVLLRNPDVRPAYMTYNQLRDVQSEICRMARIRDPEKFFRITRKAWQMHAGFRIILWLLNLIRSWIYILIGSFEQAYQMTRVRTTLSPVPETSPQ